MMVMVVVMRMREVHICMMVQCTMTMKPVDNMTMTGGHGCKMRSKG